VAEPDGKVFISVLVERHKREPTKALACAGSEAGVDRGVAVAVATWDGREGELANRENWKPKERERLRRKERQRERQKRARISDNARLRATGKETHQHKSKNQQKTELAIAAMHGRARHRRKDFVEQTSCDLAKNHRLVVFEDLCLAAMTRSAKGTVDRPGRNVRQKAGLDRAMLYKGLGALKARTDDKVIRHGHGTLCVPAPGTSITCPVPECGHVDPANRASRSVFVCVRCGHTAHADINAAVEIRKRGMKLAYAGGTPVSARLGTNQGPVSAGAKPGAVGAGRGSGNQETGYITVREVA